MTMEAFIAYKFFGMLLVFFAVVGSTIVGKQKNVDIETFGYNLGLPESEVKALANIYEEASTPSDVLRLACQTAKLCLGQAQVNLSPLNQTLVDENWSETCFAEPYCIILPTNSSGVSAAIRIFGHLEVKFAIRSGGHSPVPSWSSIGNRGILLDLQKLNSVTLSNDGTFASVGPGARWGEVYETLGAETALVVGTRIPDVGVGGSLLGGGYFYFSDQFGLAADNVKNFEVALANGTIVEANNSSNVDLFWALKGGGPNFGIVTRYDLYTVPIYEIWGQLSVYSTGQAAEILAAFDEWQENGSSDDKGGVALSIALDSVVVALIYSEPQDSPPSAFSAFNSLQPIAIPVPATNMPFVSILEILGSSTPAIPGR
ncbi:FAD-dependent monooxygenase yanF [Lachnellula suecica]|uniref:FAD-dependent monooxygenase yanF n=1 Tax=Lachnellula suecica TaxID=602035 RepID=A0A8T9C4T0_9HELO|nr:FAD-dependent monooxygenase yanF [Lachnellula suecica]